MGLILNGNAPSKMLYNGAEVSLYFNGSKIWPESSPVDPYNPLNLPANTVRVRTKDGNVPTKISGTSYETATLVSGTTDVYDVYKSGRNFSKLLRGSQNVVEVLGANTAGITNMEEMFYNCRSLTSVPLFDTSSVLSMRYMLQNTLITAVPLFNTSNVTNMDYMLNYCYKVQTGAFALYQQASTQATPPISHIHVFRDCGKDTTTGAAELAQIPDDWK